MCLFSLAPRTGAAAEESGAGKQILLDRGAYKDMDICIMYVAVAFPSFPSFFLYAWGGFDLAAHTTGATPWQATRWNWGSYPPSRCNPFRWNTSDIRTPPYEPPRHAEPSRPLGH